MQCVALSCVVKYRFPKIVVVQDENTIGTHKWTLVHTEPPKFFVPVSIATDFLDFDLSTATWINTEPSAAEKKEFKETIERTLFAWLGRIGGLDRPNIDVVNKDNVSPWMLGVDADRDEGFDLMYFVHTGHPRYVACGGTDSFKAEVLAIRWLDPKPDSSEESLLFLAGLRAAHELERLWLFRSDDEGGSWEPTLRQVN